MVKTGYVVLSYGRQDLTIKCLTTFRRFHPNDPLVLADNGGPDRERTIKIAEMFDAKYVLNPLNDSLSKLMNMGVEASETEYVCIVTNGVEFTTRLTEQFEKDFERDPLTVVVGGLLMYSDGRVQHGGGRRFWNHQAMGHYGQPHLPHQVQLCLQTAYRLYVTGATAAIRKSFWMENKYDEQLTMSCEDTDICFRAWQTGKRVFYDPAITSIHNEGSTRGRTPQEKAKNAPWAMEKEIQSLKRFKEKYGDKEAKEIDNEVNRLNAELHPELPKAFIRHGAVGDVLKSLEIYDYLEKKHGPMVVVTGVPEAFRDRNVVAITERVDEYAVSEFIDMDMTYERDRNIPISEAYWKAIGVENKGRKIEPARLKLNSNDFLQARKMLPDFDWNNKFVLFHMGGGFAGKSVPVHVWREIAFGFLKAGFKVICVGAGKDMEAQGDGVYSVVGKTSLHSLKALCEKASLFVGIDSGPLHIVEGSCPAIGLFTIVLPDRLVSSEVIGITTNAECKGCIMRQPLTTQYSCEFPQGDPRQFMCASMFDPNEIVRKGIEVARK